MQATPVFQKNLDAFNDPKIKIIVNQGGTRSSKTYSIAQLFIVRAMEAAGEFITICRKTSPSLKSSVMRDFFDILKSGGVYREAHHNKTDREYSLYGNTFEFTSLDVPQKKRGTKRDHLWLNEGNEFDYEDFFQMMIRTRGKILIDYNPSDEFHWIYDKVLPRKDCCFIKSTYKDNPFLEQSIIDEIERLQETDENYWKIYGLGEVGKRKAIIYDKWDLVDSFPLHVDDEIYGVDFGYNNPSVLLRIGVKDLVHIYIEQLIYERNLTNTDFIYKIEQLIGGTRKKIVADSAEPDRIEEIIRAGFYVEGCKKGKNSVKDGIDIVKRKRLHIVKSAAETIKEIQSYKWKEDTAGRILDEPVPFNDHSCSAFRYAIEDLNLPESHITDIAEERFKEQNQVTTTRAESERAQIIKNSRMD